MNDQKTSVLPPEIANSRVLRKKRLKQDELPGYVQELLRLFTPALLPAWFETLIRLVQAGDPKALRLVAEMYSLVQKHGGVSITNMMLAAQAPGDKQIVAFESIINQLEASSVRQVEALPTPVSDDDGA